MPLLHSHGSDGAVACSTDFLFGHTAIIMLQKSFQAVLSAAWKLLPLFIYLGNRHILRGLCESMSLRKPFPQ